MSLDTNGAPTAASPTAEQKTENEGAVTSPEGSTPAESSPADEKDAKSPVDLLSVVKDAVEKPGPEAGSSAAEGEGEAKPADEAEAKPEGEADAEAQAEADKKLPFHEHPRWKEVIAERDSFREDAGRFRQVESFMQTHGLNGDEVAEGFDIMAKLKSGDPKQLSEAREYFANGLAQLDGLLGNVLPDDLQTRVESGALDEDAAQELARTRAAERLRSQRDEERNTAETANRERQAREATATAMATAVDAWETQQKAADPDYALKAELVEAQCWAIVRKTGKQPQNPEEAVALAKQAYADVSAKFKTALPKPKPIKPSPTGSSASTVTEPKSLREAIANSLNQG